MGLLSSIGGALFGKKTKKTAVDTATQNQSATNTNQNQNTNQLTQGQTNVFGQNNTVANGSTAGNSYQQALQQLIAQMTGHTSGSTTENTAGTTNQNTTGTTNQNTVGTQTQQGQTTSQNTNVDQTTGQDVTNSTSTQNQTRDPYAAVVPYLQSFLSQMGGLYSDPSQISALEKSGLDAITPAATAANDYLDTAGNELTKTASGDYLTPDSNPYLKAIGDRISGDTMAQVNSAFANGRSTGGLRAAIGADSISKNLNQLYGTQYNNERGYQQNAATALQALAQGKMAIPQAVAAAGQRGSDLAFDRTAQQGGLLSAIAQLGGSTSGTTTGNSVTDILHNTTGTSTGVQNTNTTGTTNQNTTGTTNQNTTGTTTGQSTGTNVSDTTQNTNQNTTGTTTGQTSGTTNQNINETNQQQTQTLQAVLSQLINNIIGQSQSSGTTNEVQSKYTKGLLGKLFSAENVSNALMAGM